MQEVAAARAAAELAAVPKVGVEKGAEFVRKGDMLSSLSLSAFVLCLCLCLCLMLCLCFVFCVGSSIPRQQHPQPTQWHPQKCPNCLTLSYLTYLSRNSSAVASVSTRGMQQQQWQPQPTGEAQTPASLLIQPSITVN